MPAAFPPNEPAATPERPWMGLGAFTEESRDYFYGRDAEIGEMTDRVSRAPLTVLYGVSGYGKSSLLGAGLIPALRTAGQAVVLLRRCYDDLAKRPLAADVMAAVAAEIAGTRLEGEDAGPSLWEFFHDRRQPWLARGAPPDEPVFPVLLLDQFEEIFTKGEDRHSGDPVADRLAGEAARDFMVQLADLVENRPPAALRERLESGAAEEKRSLIGRYDFQVRPVRVAIALREDFLPRLERWRRAMPGMMEHRVELRQLSGPQALRAVYEPGAKRPGQAPIIPPEVAAAIVRTAAGVAPDTPLEDIRAVPPILSLLCERLNARRLAGNPPAAEIAATDFSAGEASRILGTFYEEKTASLPAALRDYLEDELVSGTGLRETVTLDSALATLSAARVTDAAPLLHRLVDDRILIVEDRGGLQRVEFTHDTLAKLALERRTQRHARRRRLRTLIWTGASLAIAAICSATTLWALREKHHAEVQGEAAAASARIADTERDRARAQVREASRSDLATALARIQEGAWQEGVAYLGRSLRYDPGNASALEALCTTLRDGNRDTGALPIWEGYHGATINAVAWSPDGSRLATASADRTGRIWDAVTGETIGGPLLHEDYLICVAFSPDGRHVATGSADGTARLWDAATGRPEGIPLEHGGDVMTVAFSPDGARLLTASFDGTARLWDVASGQAALPPLRHRDQVWSAAFSPDGSRIVTASSDSTAQIWDATTGGKIGRTLVHEGRVNDACFSPDGRQVLTGSQDHTARIWDATTGQPIGVPLLHPERVGKVRFSPDGSRVATCCADSSGRLWDPATGQTVGNRMIHYDWVMGLDFTRDGSRIVTASQDHTARIHDIRSGFTIGPSVRHADGVQMALFDPGGTRLATVGVDGVVRVWDLGTGQVSGLPFVHPASVNSAALSPDGKLLVTAGSDRLVRIWDTTTAAPAREPLPHPDAVGMAVFSPDGRWIAAGCADGTAQIWDLATGRPLGPPLQNGSRLFDVAFSADGRLLATAGSDGAAHVWDTATGQAAGPPWLEKATIWEVHFDPAGTRLITASDSGRACIWDPRTGRSAGPVFRGNAAFFSAQFSPDGRRVLISRGDLLTSIYDSVSGDTVVPKIELQRSSAVHARFHPTRPLFLTVTGDGRIQQWETETGRPFGTPLPSRGGTRTIAYSANGEWLATSGSDGAARVWPARPPAPLPGEIADKLAAFAAGARLNPERGSLGNLSREERLQLWEELQGPLAGFPEWRFIAATYLPRPVTAPAVYGSPRSIRWVTTQLLSLGQTSACVDAMETDPGNPLLPFTLAAVELQTLPNQIPNPARSRWLCDYAMQHLPADFSASELEAAATLIESVPGQAPKVAELRARAARAPR